MERLHLELQPIIPAAYQALTTRYSLPMEVAEADDPTNIKVFFYLMCVHPHAFVQKVLHEPNGTRLLVMDFRNTGTVSAEDLLQRTFMGYGQTTRTTSQSTTCAAGHAPRMCNPRRTASSARKATLKICLTMRTSGFSTT
ncbi:hypothetical protein PSTG_15705 [Puccinia striiformis f. sp. tritici PST-78]|uniref:Uncharacterized protein n=1 Tax=Puccinia striiformis f. sp. tritici PST-78 TaxID=1165861 RepID=A0A0L0UV17_9BASI|nr:hypothetical protein PSTG_15705 [Puccinia striiformis f. sp. tritici PST-78]